jgi:hypothetical protein
VGGFASGADIEEPGEVVKKKLLVVIALPRRPRGQLSREARAIYDAQLRDWCNAIERIASTLDFKVSSRGWCYVLEQRGLHKGDFDVAERLINACRKSGLLPLDICAVDEGREADNLQHIDREKPAQFAQGWFAYLDQIYQRYTPFSFWDAQKHYVEMIVEKIDLKNLFAPVTEELHVPCANISGWNDINARVQLIRRFKQRSKRGKKCVLLVFTDHDPGGFRIADFVRANLMELALAVHKADRRRGDLADIWEPTEENLTIERFGLDANFIDKHGIEWIDNLGTGSGDDLADPDHPDHFKDYVQDYIRKFGARKVEANALVVHVAAARKLCRDTLLKYITHKAKAPARYEAKLNPYRNSVRAEIRRLKGGRRS